MSDRKEWLKSYIPRLLAIDIFSLAEIRSLQNLLEELQIYSDKDEEINHLIKQLSNKIKETETNNLNTNQLFNGIFIGAGIGYFDEPDIKEIDRFFSSLKVAVGNENIVIYGDDAGLNAIRKNVDNLKNLSIVTSSVFVFYSGHVGFTNKDDNKELYFMASDSSFERLDKTAINGFDLLNQIDEISARKVLLFLDIFPTLNENIEKNSPYWKDGVSEKFINDFLSKDGHALLVLKEGKDKELRKDVYKNLLEAFNGKSIVREDQFIRFLDVYSFLVERIEKLQDNNDILIYAKDLNDNFPFLRIEGNPRVIVPDIDNIIVSIVNNPVIGAESFRNYLEEKPDLGISISEVYLRIKQLEYIRANANLLSEMGHQLDNKSILDRHNTIYHLLQLCQQAKKNIIAQEQFYKYSIMNEQDNIKDKGLRKKIFISYAREDQGIVEKLKENLEGHGFEIWFDQKNIIAGDNWLQSIADGLQECDVLIVVLSPYSIESEWVNNELSFAKGEDKKIIPIIHLPFRETPVYKLLLSKIQHIDFSQGHFDTNYLKLLKALSN